MRRGASCCVASRLKFTVSGGCCKCKEMKAGALPCCRTPRYLMLLTDDIIGEPSDHVIEEVSTVISKAFVPFSVCIFFSQSGMFLCFLLPAAGDGEQGSSSSPYLISTCSVVNNRLSQSIQPEISLRALRKYGKYRFCRIVHNIKLIRKICCLCSQHLPQLTFLSR